MAHDTSAHTQHTAGRYAHSRTARTRTRTRLAVLFLAKLGHRLSFLLLTHAAGAGDKERAQHEQGDREK
jgi:hypothetical protein